MVHAKETAAGPIMLAGFLTLHVIRALKLSALSVVAMAFVSAFSGANARSSSFVGTKVSAKPRSVRPAAAFTISARYRGEGTNLSKVEQFKRHDRDCGSTEIQIARLSARVEQLTRHLSEHKKDYSTRRGLLQILGQRKQLLAYLQRENKDKYDEVVQTLKIRVAK